MKVAKHNIKLAFTNLCRKLSMPIDLVGSISGVSKSSYLANQTYLTHLYHSLCLQLNASQNNHGL
jgi:hypothetical protein